MRDRIGTEAVERGGSFLGLAALVFVFVVVMAVLTFVILEARECAADPSVQEQQEWSQTCPGLPG